MGCSFIGIDTIPDDDAGRTVMGFIDTLALGMRGVPIDIPGIPTRRRAGMLARIETFGMYKTLMTLMS